MLISLMMSMFPIVICTAMHQMKSLMFDKTAYLREVQFVKKTWIDVRNRTKMVSAEERRSMSLLFADQLPCFAYSLLKLDESTSFPTIDACAKVTPLSWDFAQAHDCFLLENSILSS